MENFYAKVLTSKVVAFKWEKIPKKNCIPANCFFNKRVACASAILGGKEPPEINNR